MNRTKIRFIYTIIVIVCLFAVSVEAQNGQKILNLEDYGRWSRITSTSISPNGNWVTYAYRPNEGDITFLIKNLTTNIEISVLSGTRPVFSNDSKWIAYIITPNEEERKKLESAKKPVINKAELRKLSGGEAIVYENVSSIIFSDDSRLFVVKKVKSDKDAEHEGTDMIVRRLDSGIEENFGNIKEFQFNESGDLLAYIVDAADKAGNGIHVFRSENGSRLPLDTGKFDYERLAWNKKGSSLAVLRGEKKDGYVEKDNYLIIITGLDAGTGETIRYNPSMDSYFPDNMTVSERGAIRWSKDNTKLFFGIKEQEKEPEKSEEPIANVDVWHWKDVRIQSVQMRRADSDRNFTYRSVLNMNTMRFVRLTDENMRTISLTENSKWGIGRDNTPYQTDVSWGGSQADYYLVDISSGERKPIVAGLGRPIGASPDSKWYLYLKDKKIWAYHIESGQTSNLSNNSPVSFVNENDDHPYEKPVYGLAGWTKDGTAVILNHEFDLWSLPLNGAKPVNITGGVGDKEQIRFRYFSMDSEEDFIDTSKPLLLSAYGQWTKKTGYYTVSIGDMPQEIIFEDKRIGRPVKAENADKIIFTMQTFVDFPDYYVSDTGFSNPVKFTDANPQQDEYAWGRRILIDYKNGKGVKLQGTLTLPPGYEEGKQYPMLVYFYEIMSNRHHQYSMPTYDDRPHMSTYASNGYLVFMPDIVYEEGKPGSSALDCVTSAVKEVIKLGYADPDHIGIQGHSWGGYETSYILTQTDMFACVVTGAPVTNLVSFYNELYKSSGNNQHGIMEKGQVRMGTSPWENMKLYQSQSPVHQAEKISTPYLILHGTEDGSVDWHQGLEYYNTGRRLGKEVILLSYPGEGHHLSKKENQKDFQIRMKQFFDHYLMDKPAPDWMVNGVPFLKKGSK